MQRFAADILIESRNSSSGSSYHLASSSSSSSSEDEDETEEIDDGFVYGEGAIRTDLSFELVEQLQTFVHQALDGQSPLTSSKPAPVLVVSTNAAARPFVYNHSSSARADQLRANPRGIFGSPRNPNRPRAISRSRPAGFARTPNSNADRDSWRAELSAKRAERPSIAVAKEADTQNWRQIPEGSHWAWMDNRYQVVKA